MWRKRKEMDNDDDDKVDDNDGKFFSYRIIKHDMAQLQQQLNIH